LKTAKVLACCLLVLPLVGTARKSVPKPRATTLNAPTEKTLRASLRAVLREGGALYAAGRFQQAQQRFESLFRDALRAGITDIAARAQANAGGCQFALHQYRSALLTFQHARVLAESAGDVNAVAALDVNIASLYSEMGELDSAAAWTRGALERLSGHDREKQLPKALIQMATLRARQRRMEEAFELFRQGIREAARAADLELYAVGWNRLGEELLKRGELGAAERALLEAYYVRKVHGFALDTSYRSLGRLRLEQGDFSSASALLDRAVEAAARPRGIIPAWDMYHYRGRVRLAQGRLKEALEDLRIALRLARAWRWSIPPDEASRMAAEASLNQVHSALIEAGNRLYQETRNPALLAETFEAAEENRASSLRALLSGGGATPDLPPRYWEALSRLQRAEIDALRAPGPQAGEALAGARAELTRVEAAAQPGGIGRTNSNHPDVRGSSLLRQVRKALPAGAALLSFHLGESGSWLWALDGAGLDLRPLPPRRILEEQARTVNDLVRNDAPQAASAGAALYGALFGGLAVRFRADSRWLLALDGPLFEVPFAALPEEMRPAPIYLAERRDIEVVPGAGFWLDHAAQPRAPAASDLFVGVGDPVYNTADPRLPVRSIRSSGPGPQLLMGRLVASGAELDACARAWGGDRTLLRGLDASRRGIAAQLGRRPAILHFATHVLESSSSPSYGLIALSLTDRGETEVLPPMEVERWKVDADVVVLSGCRSAAGAAPAGTGLLGLTRAWLAAGARTVVGSWWPAPDEEGALFSAFYRRLRSQPRRDPAAALRAAQSEMIRSAGWRSRPRYWGAYFAIGSE
jgi:tetratricopeptide (TPR) repeat protein